MVRLAMLGWAAVMAVSCLARGTAQVGAGGGIPARDAPHTASGEVYAWQPSARERSSDHEADARLLEARAALDQASAMQAAGRYPEAVVSGERALQALEAARAGSPELARCLVWLG